MRKLMCLAAVCAAVWAAEKKLGQPMTLDRPMPVRDLLAKPEASVGKVVQVKGKVTEVCMMMGCWMALADLETGAVLRVKVNDGDIVFPKESIGKEALAEGKLAKLVLSRQQAVDMARHEAEEQGRKFDPATIRSGKVIYQIQGSGAVILE